MKTFIVTVDNYCLSYPTPFINVHYPATVSVQPGQQIVVQAAQTAMQPQNTPQHQQLFKQQQTSTFLSPQSNPQVGR